jgi:hypothetical protein
MLTLIPVFLFVIFTRSVLIHELPANSNEHIAAEYFSSFQMQDSKRDTLRVGNVQ